MLNLFDGAESTGEAGGRKAQMEEACLSFVGTLTQVLQAVLSYAAKREAEADAAKAARGQQQ